MIKLIYFYDSMIWYIGAYISVNIMEMHATELIYNYYRIRIMTTLETRQII